MNAGPAGADEAREDPAVSIGQLKWRARRGARELDLVLQRYIDGRYAAASPERRRAFVRLLEQSDADLLDWLLGRARPPAEFADVIGALTADA